MKLQNANARDAPLTTLWNEDLACALVQTRVGYLDGVVILELMERHRCDMRGAIKVATAALPRVMEVRVFSGQALDVVYAREQDADGGFTPWVAHTPARAIETVPA